MAKDIQAELQQIETTAKAPVTPYAPKIDMFQSVASAGVQFGKSVMAQQAESYAAGVDAIEKAGLGQDAALKRLGVLNAENKLALLVNPYVRSSSQMAKDNFSQIDQRTLDLADKLAEQTTTSLLANSMSKYASLDEWKTMRDEQVELLRTKSSKRSLSSNFAAEMQAMDRTAELAFKVSAMGVQKKFDGYANVTTNTYINAHPVPDLASFSATLDAVAKEVKSAPNADAVTGKVAYSILHSVGGSKFVAEAINKYPQYFTPEQVEGLIGRAGQRDQQVTSPVAQFNEIEKQVESANRKGFYAPINSGLIINPKRRKENEYLADNPMDGQAPEILRAWPGGPWSDLAHQIANQFELDFAKDPIKAISDRGVGVSNDLGIVALSEPIYSPETGKLLGLDAFKEAYRSNLKAVGWVKNTYYAVDRARGIGTSAINAVMSEEQTKASQELYAALPATARWTYLSAIGDLHREYNNTQVHQANKFDIYKVLSAATGDPVGAGFYALSEKAPQTARDAFYAYTRLDINQDSKSRRSALETVAQDWLREVMGPDGYVSADLIGTETDATYTRLITGLELQRSGSMLVDLEKRAYASKENPLKNGLLLDVYEPKKGVLGGSLSPLGAGPIIMPLGGIEKMTTLLKNSAMLVPGAGGIPTSNTLASLAAYGRIKLVPVPHSITDFYIHYAQTEADKAANNYVPVYLPDGVNKRVLSITGK